MASGLNNIGFIYYYEGDVKKALDFFEKSLKINEELDNKISIAESFNNIAQVYDSQGNIPKALDYYEKGLKIFEKTNNKKGITDALNGIGLIYKSQGEISKGLEYFNRSLKMQEETGDKKGESNSLNNIASVYLKVKEYEKAIDYFGRSLKIREALNDKMGMALVLQNMAVVYYNQKEYIKCLEYSKKSIALKKECGDKNDMPATYHNMGALYFRLWLLEKHLVEKQKKLQLAFFYLDTSLVFSKELGAPIHIRNAEKLLCRIDSVKGKSKGAFEHYKQYIIYRDSINNEGTRKASIKSQLKYEYEKKEAVIKEQQNKERVVAEEKNRFQQIVIGSVVLGLLLVIIFAAFVFRSLRTTRQQKIIIEVKQKEILDSIHYAKRIQTALMTNEIYIERKLNELSN